MKKLIAVLAIAIAFGAQAQDKKVKAAADEMKRDFAATLKDPDSAKFRNLVVYEKGGGIAAMCGEVNAKNAYGGYAGFRRFFTLVGALRTGIEKDEDGGAASMDRMYAIICDGKPTKIQAQ